MAGREACLQAINAGCDTILLTTNHQANLLPIRKGIQYFIYGDATPSQLQVLYGSGHSKKQEQIAYRNLGKYGDNVTFLCMSEWYAQGLRKEYCLPAERTPVLPVAVDHKLWRPSTSAKNHKKKVVFVGGDFKRKGGPLLREVASMVGSAAEFVYITKHQFEQRENETLVTGLKPDAPELVEHVRTADIFALPTRADCSPNACVEAASCGLPIVSSSVGGIPELVLDGKTGKIVNEHTAESYRDAILTYLMNDDLRVREGSKARELVEAKHTLAGQMGHLRQLIGVA
jgi:glycosyltransferase involved in cell wall biosynthesis